MERQHRAIEESLRKSLRALASEGSTQEELITVRGERFVIPVKAEFRRRVPGVIHGSSSSGQTVFVEPLETIEQNNELVRLLDEEQREIHRILVAMTRAIGEQATRSCWARRCWPRWRVTSRGHGLRMSWGVCGRLFAIPPMTMRLSWMGHPNPWTAAHGGAASAAGAAAATLRCISGPNHAGAGARCAQLIISGRIPAARRWR